MMCWILFTHRLPLSSDDEKVLGRQHVSTEEKRMFSFLSLLWFFLELGTRLFFVFCYFGLHRQTHTHSIQTTAHWCRLIMKKKENCTLRYVVCLTPTHVWPTCYLSSSRVENIPPTDSFMITSQHFETHGQEQKDMAIKPSCCLLSHSEI